MGYIIANRLKLIIFTFKFNCAPMRHLRFLAYNCVNHLYDHSSKSDLFSFYISVRIVMKICVPFCFIEIVHETVNQSHEKYSFSCLPWLLIAIERHYRSIRKTLKVAAHLWNGYLSHRIIDSFPRIIRIQFCWA